MNIPRTVEVILPSKFKLSLFIFHKFKTRIELSSEGEVAPWREGEHHQMTMLSLCERQHFDRFHYYSSVVPRWNDRLQRYVLDYNNEDDGRVPTRPSVKNFQLALPGVGNEILLQVLEKTSLRCFCKFFYVLEY
jgi:hypothetical protein